jgi:hypothetical protein
VAGNGKTMKRIRAFFESILFVGLKPAGQKVESKKIKWLGPLGGPVERFLSGGAAASDPLYLTNRSLGQKARSWALIAAPCLILALGIGVALSNILDPPKVKPAAEPTAKELSAKILPNIDSHLKIEQTNEIDVVELRIEHTGASRLTGILRNTTNKDLSAHLVVDLTDTSGSQLGGVEARVDNIPASKTKTFSIPITQRSAAFALVREIGSAR